MTIACVKTKLYRIFKDELENYVITLIERDKITLCRFRCRSHNIPINTGRSSQCAEYSMFSLMNSLNW